jgi:hypothetical protein
MFVSESLVVVLWRMWVTPEELSIIIHSGSHTGPKLFFIFKRDSFIIPLRGMRGKNLHLLVAPVCAGGFLKKRVSLGIKDLDSYPQPVQAT